MGFVAFPAGLERVVLMPSKRADEVGRVQRVNGIEAVNRADHNNDLPSVAAKAYQKATDRHTDARREPARTVGQVMTSPIITLLPSATLAQARTLLQTRRFRHVPIADECGRLQGMVSDRDLLRSRSSPPTTALRDVMSDDVLAVIQNTGLRDVAAAMLSERISAMPVINASDLPIGIITSSDLLRCILTDAPIELWV